MDESLTILFVDYIDKTFCESGSGVRPSKMLKAFHEHGYHVIELTGNQASKNRKKSVKEILKLLAKTKIDICYIESPTYPILRHCDRKLIKKLAQYKIPTGYFYRDFYRKFPDQFPRRTSVSGKIKDFGLDLLQYLTDRVLKYCYIVYVPSKECFELLNYKQIKALPPAGENQLSPNRQANKIGIYVGGISGAYNGQLILEVFAELNNHDNYELILVCREKEWQQFKSPYKNEKWLSVFHVSGKELEPLYKKASFAVAAPNKDYLYSTFAVSVKIFEYISFGLPVVAVNTKAVSRIITEENIGITVNDNKTEFADAIEKLTKNENVYSDLQHSIKNALLNRNLWKHRVEQVVSDLLMNNETE